MLYFTIFLNQLDNLRAYTPNGTSRLAPPLIGVAAARLLAGLVEETVMTFGRASVAGRFSRLFSRPRSEGGGPVVCASAMPLLVLALAVAADYANVSRFRTRVQLAADAASLATAEAVARHPDRAGGTDVDDLASEVADAVFVSHAPRGARGAPTVAVKSRAAAVTATVGYAGVAPSNFGSALGYDSIRVGASATSLTRVADSRSTAAR
jgi:Flp pilus assembly protein TadG